MHLISKFSFFRIHGTWKGKVWVLCQRENEREKQNINYDLLINRWNEGSRWKKIGRRRRKAEENFWMSWDLSLWDLCVQEEFINTIVLLRSFSAKITTTMSMEKYENGRGRRGCVCFIAYIQYRYILHSFIFMTYLILLYSHRAPTLNINEFCIFFFFFSFFFLFFFFFILLLLLLSPQYTTESILYDPTKKRGEKRNVNPAIQTSSRKQAPSKSEKNKWFPLNLLFRC